MKTKLFFVLSFLAMSLVKAQLITTIGGTGISGFSGDGEQATKAGISAPWIGRMDAAGNIYISDFTNRIRKINTAGIITTIAGNGTAAYSGDGGQATVATLNNPLGIAIDATGNIYISDYNNNIIRMVNTAGVISTVAGTRTAGFNGDNIPATSAELNYPLGITLDAKGNLFIADGGNNRIRMINKAGMITTVAGNGTGGFGSDGVPATSTELNGPIAIAFDVSGNMYISDQQNQRIRMVNAAGIINNVAGSGPTGSNYGGYSGDGGQATNAKLNLPSDIIFDSQGNLYITDCANHCIRKVNTLGIITTIAGKGTGGFGGDGGLAIQAKLYFPGSTCTDTNGNIYIVDQSNNRIRKVGCGTSLPAPGFKASSTVLCAGSSITFSDSTVNTLVTDWHWDFPGGVLVNGSTLTDSMPQVTYTASGIYAVSYTASNSAGQASISKTAYMHVEAANGKYNSDFTEGFETASVPGTDWSVESSAGTNWMLTSSAAANGTKSVMLNNLTNNPNDTSILTSPTFDLAAIGSPLLAFSMAYQQKLTTNTDKLVVYVSADCGATWVSKWTHTGTALQPTSVSGQNSSSSFIPSPSEFTTYTVNINTVASNTNAMFRWVFYAGASSVGNNIYLDNINVYKSVTGIKNIETAISLNLYPNPSSGIANIAFTLLEKHSISVEVVDILGRVVETVPTQSYIEGESILTIANHTHYEPGIYFVNMNIDGQGISKKIIMQ